MEPNNKLSTELEQKSLDPISFFSENNDFVLAYKKTEKLASAVYMITSLLSDSEPMKWTLRKKVGELLSYILTYKDAEESSLLDFVYNAKSRTLELVSLLEISHRGGLVSQMNFSILKQEFLNLIEILNNSDSLLKQPDGNTLSKKYFDTPKNYPNYENSHNKLYRTSSVEGPVQEMSLNNLKDSSFGVDKDSLKKSNRQNVILGLLKKKKELTIKDLALVIKDCGEKTIQRELNSLISLGVLKRAGVRRWSKYSLV
jgi:hypothetical protein